MSAPAEPEIVTRFRKVLDETSDEDLEAMAYNSPALHFCLFMEIQDKNKRWIRPVPNVLQLRVSEVIETLRARCPGTRIRIIGVKPRRAGLSTFSLHCGYHEAMRRPIEGNTIADCKENSEMLVEKLGQFSSHDSFPWGNPIVRSPRGEFEWRNGSKWTVDTAENPDAGVGGTRQFGHYSEVSKYPQTKVKNDVKTMTASLPALSGDDTIAIAESTPEGAQGWFHGTFEDAMWLEDFLKRYDEGFRPEQVWIRVFAAWWEFADYQRQNPVSDAEKAEFDRTLSDIERDERQKYNLTYEQLAWRRDTLAAECDGNPKIFAYYYPSDPVTCWLASGSPRFDMEKIARWKKLAVSISFETGYLVRQAGEGRGPAVFQPTHDGTGEIQVWEKPREGCCYIVTCDPATGESQTIGEDPDRTSIKVWRRGYFDATAEKYRPARIVARVIAPFVQADDDIAIGHIDRLSWMYGRCIVGLEVNQGLGILRGLQDLGVPLYKRVVVSARTNRKEEQWGFRLTDMNQRRMLVDAYAAAVRMDEVEIPCVHTLEEMAKFTRKPNGKYEAARGAHDDDVMCDVMAWEVLPSATTFVVRAPKPAKPADRWNSRRKTGWRSVNNANQGW